MAKSYAIKDADDVLHGGTDTLDDVAKAAALLVGGYIEDEDGAVVYESEPYLEQKARDAE